MSTTPPCNSGPKRPASTCILPRLPHTPLLLLCGLQPLAVALRSTRWWAHAAPHTPRARSGDGSALEGVACLQCDRRTVQRVHRVGSAAPADRTPSDLARARAFPTIIASAAERTWWAFPLSDLCRTRRPRRKAPAVAQTVAQSRRETP